MQALGKLRSATTSTLDRMHITGRSPPRQSRTSGEIDASDVVDDESALEESLENDSDYPLHGIDVRGVEDYLTPSYFNVVAVRDALGFDMTHDLADDMAAFVGSVETFTSSILISLSKLPSFHIVSLDAEYRQTMNIPNDEVILKFDAFVQNRTESKFVFKRGIPCPCVLTTRALYYKKVTILGSQSFRYPLCTAGSSPATFKAEHGRLNLKLSDRVLIVSWPDGDHKTLDLAFRSSEHRQEWLTICREVASSLAFFNDNVRPRLKGAGAVEAAATLLSNEVVRNVMLFTAVKEATGEERLDLLLFSDMRKSKVDKADTDCATGDDDEDAERKENHRNCCDSDAQIEAFESALGDYLASPPERQSGGEGAFATFARLAALAKGRCERRAMRLRQKNREENADFDDVQRTVKLFVQLVVDPMQMCLLSGKALLSWESVWSIVALTLVLAVCYLDCLFSAVIFGHVALILHLRRLKRLNRLSPLTRPQRKYRSPIEKVRQLRRYVGKAQLGISNCNKVALRGWGLYSSESEAISNWYCLLLAVLATLVFFIRFRTLVAGVTVLSFSFGLWKRVKDFGSKSAGGAGGRRADREGNSSKKVVAKLVEVYDSIPIPDLVEQQQPQQHQHQQQGGAIPARVIRMKEGGNSRGAINKVFSS